MNRENMQKAIAVMKRVAANKDRKFSMSMWQSGDSVITESQAVECGTVCCFAGWLSISPEFDKELAVVESSTPVSKITGNMGSNAIADVLGIDKGKAKNMCGMDYYKPYSDSNDVLKRATSFYGVIEYKDITPEVVVKKLEQMLLEDTTE